MSRAIVLVCDSFGIGATQDADHYGNAGANTLAHIAHACARGECDVAGVRQGPLKIPHLLNLGLGVATMESAGKPLPELATSRAPTGFYGYAEELSLGKDTPSGHWEMMGVPVLFEWGYFPDTVPCFPEKLIQDFIREAKIPGILGNCHASGTTIIETHGAEHVATGKPIVYTSADSVFQIACHEKYFGLERLYEICDIARRLVDDYQIGRVIARPFIGEAPHFTRTGNRRDLAVLPPAPTLLDDLKAMGREVIAVGKIGDIFAHQGMTQTLKANGNDALFDVTLKAFADAPAGSLVFSNFVDFDTLYGHRRDVTGYANALEQFDARLPELFALLQPDDLLIITADHGCDPTWEGSDHTREHIPVIGIHPQLSGKNVGLRSTFADIGQTIATHLGVKKLAYGTSFL